MKKYFEIENFNWVGKRNGAPTSTHETLIKIWNSSKPLERLCLKDLVEGIKIFGPPPLRLRNVLIPPPHGCGSVKVRFRGTSVSGLQALFLAGWQDPRVFLFHDKILRLQYLSSGPVAAPVWFGQASHVFRFRFKSPVYAGSEKIQEHWRYLRPRGLVYPGFYQ